MWSATYPFWYIPQRHGPSSPPLSWGRRNSALWRAPRSSASWNLDKCQGAEGGVWVQCLEQRVEIFYWARKWSKRRKWCPIWILSDLKSTGLVKTSCSTQQFKLSLSYDVSFSSNYKWSVKDYWQYIQNTAWEIKLRPVYSDALIYCQKCSSSR